VKDLPVLPRTLMVLREKLADPNASVKEVVKLVEQDIRFPRAMLRVRGCASGRASRRRGAAIVFRKRERIRVAAQHGELRFFDGLRDERGLGRRGLRAAEGGERCSEQQR
jgi:hypothetical protein